jgi:serine/threonine protein kinase
MALINREQSSFLILALPESTRKAENFASNNGGTGTPRYMAPEIARMEEDFGFLGNLYSFAIVLWQILTTRVPFSEFKTPTEFYAKVVLGEQRASLKYPKNKINHWKYPKSIREYHQVNVMRSLGPVMKCRRGKGINPNSLH